MLTDERKAEIDAKLEAIFNRPKPKPKPKLVVDADVVVADVDVPVHPADRNSRYGTVDVVEVRKPDPEWLAQELPRRNGRFDRVTLDLALAEVQQQDRQRTQARLAPPDRMADPMNLWGGRRDD
jgi:hypothetical protein